MTTPEVKALELIKDVPVREFDQWCEVFFAKVSEEDGIPIIELKRPIGPVYSAYLEACRELRDYKKIRLRCENDRREMVSKQLLSEFEGKTPL